MKNRNLAPSGEKTDMENLDVLRGEVEQVLNLSRAYVERRDEMEWRPDLDDYRTFLAIFKVKLRGVLIRQFESLEVVLDLVGRNKGAVAGPLLRPACEEFFWVRYLATIQLDYAEHILRLAGLQEMYHNLTATDGMAGSSETERLGLKPHMERTREHKDKRHDALSEIGKKLEWPERKGKIQIPSVRWIARKVEREDIYKSVYHATSRFVHFSVVNLGGKVRWSESDKKTLISSAHSGDRLNMFFLHWGALLFIYTMREILGFPIISEDDRAMVRGEIDLPSIERIGERIEKRGSPPIISSRELAWPDTRMD